ncbi:MAG: diguanylate cyclase [Nitrospirae bacterium]|nr:diguanylate cyclase [Nitrospirota bacterium]
MTDDPGASPFDYADSATGVFDRRHVEAKLREEVRRARRDNSPLTVLLVDIDYFKIYNDTLGRNWGDRLLRRFAEVLGGNLKPIDTLGRQGGDEFVILLPAHDLSVGAEFARQLLKSVSSAQYPGQELFEELFPQGKLTASIGATAMNPALQAETDLLAWADYALYRAKRLGRNRVVLQEGPPHSAESRRQPLKLFENLAALFSRASDRDRKLQDTAAAIQQWLAIDVCSLYLLEDRALTLRATAGLNPDSVGRVIMTTSEGLTGLVIETMTTVCARDAAKHPRFKYFPETGEERYGSYLGVPILYENTSLGVVVVQTKAIQDFSEEDVTVVKTIAGFLGGFLGAFLSASK